MTAKLSSLLRLHFSSLKEGWIWQRVPVDSGHLEIIGDPDAGCYEWLLRDQHDKPVRHSDCGYGIPAIALRDGLIDFYGTPDSPLRPVTL